MIYFFLLSIGLSRSQINIFFRVGAQFYKHLFYIYIKLNKNNLQKQQSY
jgi:hypothetical protein